MTTIFYSSLFLTAFFGLLANSFIDAIDSNELQLAAAGKRKAPMDKFNQIVKKPSVVKDYFKNLNAAQHNPDPMTFMSSYQGNYNGEVLENAINHGAHSQSPPKDSWEDYTNAQLDEIWQKVAENENGEDVEEWNVLNKKIHQREYKFRGYEYDYERPRGDTHYWKCKYRKICHGRISIYKQKWLRINAMHTCVKEDPNARKVHGKVCLLNPTKAGLHVKFICEYGHRLALSVWAMNMKTECQNYMLDMQQCNLENGHLYFQVTDTKENFQLHFDDLNGINTLNNGKTDKMTNRVPKRRKLN